MLQVTCTRCQGPLWPWDPNGGCHTCRIRPDERLVGAWRRAYAYEAGMECRLGRDGKRRAVRLNGRKA